MEVGPLARVLMLYATGNKQTKELVDYTLKTLDVPVTALFSTLGRTAARGLESKVIADAMQGMFDNLMANIKAGARVFTDGLACFNGFDEAGMKHVIKITGGGRPTSGDFKWVNTGLGNRK